MPRKISRNNKKEQIINKKRYSRWKTHKLHPYRYHIGTILILLLGSLVTLGIASNPNKSSADSSLTNFIFTPFGGQIIYSGPATSPACHAITRAIWLASAGTINISIHEIIVGSPERATVGMLTINGFPLPSLQKVYDYGNLTPKTNVIGLSLSLCDVCNKSGANKIPGIKNICKSTGIDKIISSACSAIATTCKPATNLLYSIGTGDGPSSLNLGL